MMSKSLFALPSASRCLAARHLSLQIAEASSSSSSSSTSSSSSVHAQSATAIQRALRMKAREEADANGSKEKQNKITLQSALQKNKKPPALDDLYEMQAVRSSAHEFREKKLKGQIPYDCHADSKNTSNGNKTHASGSDASSAGEKQSNWIPLITAILGIFSLTIFSANKLNAQADHIKETDGTLALDMHIQIPTISSSSSSSSLSSSSSTSSSVAIHHHHSNGDDANVATDVRAGSGSSSKVIASSPMQQQPLWLQRPRSEPRAHPKP